MEIPGWQSLQQICCLQKGLFSQQNKTDEIPVELKYFQKKLKLLAKGFGVKMVMSHRKKKKKGANAENNTQIQGEMLSKEEMTLLVYYKPHSFNAIIL